MAEKVPVKAKYTGADVTAIGEFEPGDYLPISAGGTGGSTVAAALAALGIDTAVALPSFTATGAITVGKTVAVNTDGTVSQVAVTGSALPADTIQTLSSVGASYLVEAAYDEAFGVGLAVFKHTSGYPFAVAFTTTSTGFTVGTPVQLAAVAASPCVTGLGGGVFACAWLASATSVSAAVVSATTGLVVTVNTPVSATIATNGTFGSIKCATRSATEALVVVSGSSQHSASRLTISGTTLSHSVTNGLGTAGANNAFTYALRYDATNDKFIWAAGVGAAAAPYVDALYVLTVSAGAITAVTFTGAYHQSTAPAHGPSALVALGSGYFAFLHNNYSAAILSVALLQLVGTTLTLIDSVPLIATNSASAADLAYVAAEKKIYVAGYLSGSVITAKTIDFDDVAIRLGRASTGAGTIYNAAAVFEPRLSSFGHFPTLGKFIVGFAPSATGFPTLTWWSPQTKNVAGFVGIAQATVAAGAAVQVKGPGQTDLNQAGLIAGRTYFVADDGTLTLDPTAVKAGKALAATKLLLGA